MSDIILSHSHDHVTADSRDIAEHFGKQHKHVIEAVEKLAEQTLAENSTDLFYPSTYLDTYGREQKNYLMTRDGFSLLVMGFTGKAALAWKLKYIAAFNAMESKIRETVKAIAAPDPLKAKRIEIMERNSLSRRAQNAVKLIDRAGDKLTETERAAIAVAALNELMGRHVALPPVVTARHTTSEIAAELGVSVQSLSRKIQGLKTPEHGEERLSKSQYSDKAVNQWYWTDKGKQEVIKAWREAQSA